MTTLTLPWPPKELSPNARVHWSKRYSVGRKQKADAWILAAAAYGSGWIGMTNGVSVGLTFCPPNARHYDADNLVARMKWALDGVAKGFGIDDSAFRLEAPVIARPQPPHGCVIVTLTPVAKPEAA